MENCCHHKGKTEEMARNHSEDFKFLGSTQLDNTSEYSKQSRDSMFVRTAQYLVATLGSVRNAKQPVTGSYLYLCVKMVILSLRISE